MRFTRRMGILLNWFSFLAVFLIVACSVGVNQTGSPTNPAISQSVTPTKQPMANGIPCNLDGVSQSGNDMTAQFLCTDKNSYLVRRQIISNAIHLSAENQDKSSCSYRDDYITGTVVIGVYMCS